MNVSFSKEDISNLIKSGLIENNLELVGDLDFKVKTESKGYGNQEHNEMTFDKVDFEVRAIGGKK